MGAFIESQLREKAGRLALRHQSREPFIQKTRALFPSRSQFQKIFNGRGFVYGDVDRMRTSHFIPDERVMDFQIDIHGPFGTQTPQAHFVSEFFPRKALH